MHAASRHGTWDPLFSVASEGQISLIYTAVDEDTTVFIMNFVAPLTV